MAAKKRQGICDSGMQLRTLQAARKAEKEAPENL